MGRRTTEGVNPALKIHISGSASGLTLLQPAAMKGVLQGMVAIPHAQRSLSFDSTEPVIRLIVLQALDIATAEHSMHREIAPDSDQCKGWGRRQELLRRAVRLLDSLKDVPAIAGMRLATDMLKRGHLTEAERNRAAAERPQVPGGS